MSNIILQFTYIAVLTIKLVMNDQNSTTTSAPSDVDFNKVSDIKVLSGKPDFLQSNGTTEPAKPTEEEEEDEEDYNDIADNEGDENEEPELDNQRAQEEGHEGDDSFELDEDQVDNLIQERLGMPVDQIQAILAENEQLREKAKGLQFASEKHQKAYEFINKYSGSDWGSGLERFAKLHSLDIEKMDPKDAMKELYYQQNPSLPRDKADKMFEHEFNLKYGAIDDEEIAQTKTMLDGNKAKDDLQKMQSETQSVKSEETFKEADKSRTDFLKGVEDSIADLDNLMFSVDGDPDSEFNFEITNKDEIREAMSDISQFFNKSGWVDEKGVFNYDKMKVDYAFMFNKEKILQSYYQHGQEVAKEKLLREMQNKTPKDRKQNLNPKPGPRTTEEALDEAILNHPSLKRKM